MSAPGVGEDPELCPSGEAGDHPSGDLTGHHRDDACRDLSGQRVGQHVDGLIDNFSNRPNAALESDIAYGGGGRSGCGRATASPHGLRLTLSGPPTMARPGHGAVHAPIRASRLSGRHVLTLGENVHSLLVRSVMVSLLALVLNLPTVTATVRGMTLAVASGVEHQGASRVDRLVTPGTDRLVTPGTDRLVTPEVNTLVTPGLDCLMLPVAA